jgi:uncharacterized protein
MTKSRTVRRATTGDRGPPEQRIEIPITEQIGPNMSRTRHGNLLCRNVPIARVGWMAYGPDETPIQAGPDGIARVYRSEDELFRPETIGSFMGSAVVSEHPDEDVTPKNWKQLAQGFSLDNVRRGEGEDADVLLADLIITDEQLIEAVLSGKREVSCGYDADYEATAEGEGKQSNIIGNHIALVEKGRCGPRCAIGDQAFIDPNRKETKMATSAKTGKPASARTGDKRAQVRALFEKATRDAEMLMGNNAEPDENEGGASGETEDESNVGTAGPGGATHIHIHAGPGGGNAPSTHEGMEKVTSDEGEQAGDPYEARFAAIESGLTALTQAVQKLAGAEAAETNETIEGEGMDEDPDLENKGSMNYTEDEGEELPTEKKPTMDKARTGDSAALATGYQALLAQAEILVPGFRAPTFDSKAKRTKTIDTMCGLRRKVLDLAYSTAQGKEIIDSVSGTKSLNLAKMDCQGTANLFRAAAGAKSLLNNRQATGDSGIPGKAQQAAQPKGPMTIAQLNAANAKFWEGRVAKG